MQAYDLIMLIVIGMATIFGAIKGFAWQVASLASILISYLVAYRFKGQVAEMIHAAPPWNQFLAMLILYVGTSFVIWVGFRLLSGAIDKVKLKEFDRHIGAAFGLGKGLIYCLLITMFAMSLLGPKQQTAICQSRSGYYITSALDKGVGILPKEIHDVVGPYLERLDEKLKNGQNGMPMTNDPSWSDGLAGQGGDNWDLDQLIPSVLQGQVYRRLSRVLAILRISFREISFREIRIQICKTIFSRIFRKLETQAIRVRFFRQVVLRPTTLRRRPETDSLVATTAMVRSLRSNPITRCRDSV
jgi:membrane protein required for colicin V production